MRNDIHWKIPLVLSIKCFIEHDTFWAISRRYYATWGNRKNGGVNFKKMWNSSIKLWIVYPGIWRALGKLVYDLSHEIQFVVYKDALISIIGGVRNGYSHLEPFSKRFFIVISSTKVHYYQYSVYFPEIFIISCNPNNCFLGNWIWSRVWLIIWVQMS